jgi:hypothetical protein
MIKNFKIDNIRTELDGVKTVFFSTFKTRVEGTGSVVTSRVRSTFVVPGDLTEEQIETELFKLLEKSGWV